MPAIELTTASSDTVSEIRAALLAASTTALAAEAEARADGDDAIEDQFTETPGAGVVPKTNSSGKIPTGFLPAIASVGATVTESLATLDRALQVPGAIAVGAATPNAITTIYSKVAQLLNAGILKSVTSSTDGNMDGGCWVHHDLTYSSTPGYAGVFQVYSLAGGEGLALGCNTYEGFTTTPPYSPAEDAQPVGHVRIELGPYWPVSEAARWNNQGDYLHGWVALLVQDMSQTGDVVTCAAAPFLPSIVGEYIAWTHRASGGKRSCVDRITEYISATQVRVESERTIALQSAKVVYYGAIIDKSGNTTITNGHFTRRDYQGADNDSTFVRDYVRRGTTTSATLVLFIAATGPTQIIQVPNHFATWQISVTGLSVNGTYQFSGVRRFTTRLTGGVLTLANLTTVGTDVVVGSFTPNFFIEQSAGTFVCGVEDGPAERMVWSLDLKANTAVIV